MNEVISRHPQQTQAYSVVNFSPFNSSAIEGDGLYGYLVWVKGLHFPC